MPLAGPVAAALRTLEVGRLKSKYIFLNTADRPIHENLNSCFERIVRRAGLVDENGKTKHTCHDLRRSVATELLRRGVHAKVVQRILGHADLATTMKHYVGVADADMVAAIRRLG